MEKQTWAGLLGARVLVAMMQIFQGLMKASAPKRVGEGQLNFEQSWKEGWLFVRLASKEEHPR